MHLQPRLSVLCGLEESDLLTFPFALGRATFLDSETVRPFLQWLSFLQVELQSVEPVTCSRDFHIHLDFRNSLSVFLSDQALADGDMAPVVRREDNNVLIAKRS